MSDVWVTIMVIGGLIGVWQGQVWNIPQLQSLDVFLSFPVAVLVFSSGWKVLTENLPWLVDEMAILYEGSANAPEVIHAIAIDVPGVVNCHSIASRGVVGRQVFIDMHMIVDAVDVETAHRITEEVEARLEQRFSPVRILIHVEPPAYHSDQISYDSGEKEEVKREVG